MSGESDNSFWYLTGLVWFAIVVVTQGLGWSWEGTLVLILLSPVLVPGFLYTAYLVRGIWEAVSGKKN